MKKVYKGHLLPIGRNILLFLFGLASVLMILEGEYSFPKLLLKLIGLWAVVWFVFTGAQKKTYGVLENGWLSQRDKWHYMGEVQVKDIVGVWVGEVGFVPPAGRALCVVISTKENPELLAFEVTSYPESELMRLLRDIKEENPNVQYDEETYAIMQGRSKYYHGLVNPLTNEFVGDDRDEEFKHFRDKDK